MHATGSVWRKWDLHIHTPASFNWRGDEQFSGTDPQRTSQAAAAILSKMKQTGIAVFGIMDYWTFDGFRHLRDYLRQHPDPDLPTLLPGMEIRLEAPTARRLHTHVLLSERLTDRHLIDFTAHLKLRIQNQLKPLSDQALIEYARSLDPSALEKHGAQVADRQDEETMLRVGRDTATITRESLDEAMQMIPHQMGLVVQPFDCTGGLNQLKWQEHVHAAADLLQLAAMFEARKQETINLFLGKKTTENQDFIQAFLEALGGRPKPAVSGSDAHCLHDYGTYPSNRITWIKAEPTFQGLLQTLRDPAHRTFIGAEPPCLFAQRTEPSRYIASVAVKKVETSTLREKWFDGSVPLNPGLVAVIGPKGSGKSALADIIALLGGWQEGGYEFLNSSKFCATKENKAKSFIGTLTWLDGATTVARLSDAPVDTSERVRYLPQSRIERICNEIGTSDGGQFQRELERVVFSHVPDIDRLGQASLQHLIEYRTKPLHNRRQQLTNRVTSLVDQIVKLEESTSEEAVTALTSRIAHCRQNLLAHARLEPIPVEEPGAARDEEHQTQLEAAVAATVSLREQAREADENLKSAALLVAAGRNMLTRLATLERHIADVGDDAAEDLSVLGISWNELCSVSLRKQVLDDRIAAEAVIHEKEQSRRAVILAELSNADAVRAGIVAKLDEPNKAYQRYLEERAAWASKRDELVGDATKPDTLAYLERALDEARTVKKAELTALVEQCRQTSRDIFSTVLEEQAVYQALYFPVQSFVYASEAAAFGPELAFSAALSVKGFASEFVSLISQSARGTFYGVEQGKTKVDQLLACHSFGSAEGTLSFIDDVLNHLRSDRRTDDVRPVSIRDQLRRGATQQRVYELLYSLNYISLELELTSRGRRLPELSPGEKGALLLTFYLLVDRSNVPIVIDQPEQNLDNESVYRHLVPCIREAAERRQVIVVTHNPNLAIVCDADQIVVANLDKASGHEVTYTGGAIETSLVASKAVEVLEGTWPAFDQRSHKYQYAGVALT